MIVYSAEEYPQMSPEWFAVKAGVPSASTSDTILTAGGKLSAQADDKINFLIADGLGLIDDRRRASKDEQRGIELEPDARTRFEFDMDIDVGQTGWITNDAGTAGCSPDGLVDYTGGIPKLFRPGWETKCPAGHTHVGYLRKALKHHMYENVYGELALPSKYKAQVHWSMAVTGIQSWWFVSYHPELKPMYVLVKANDYTVKMRAALNMFIARLADERKKLGLI